MKEEQWDSGYYGHKQLELPAHLGLLQTADIHNDKYKRKTLPLCWRARSELFVWSIQMAIP